MAEDLYSGIYNPDVLSCLANLSNDEVFTLPGIANQVLDLLPQTLFEDPATKFLDPACKSGVFLREIAKRLLKGLEQAIPDLQQRIDHIFHQQLYGIAITELTSLLSRRGLYCSKYPNSIYSVTAFNDAEGNIRFKRINHHWLNGKCLFCGASQSQYDRDITLETHAYESIHITKPEEIFKMKFDVIISNPPYQLNTSNIGKQAKPIYNLFVEQAIKLNPRFLTMIIPSRWFSGGIGLNNFRDQMMSSHHISKVVDYANAKECFPQNSISGGVCYFLWEKDYKGICEFTNVSNGQINSMNRLLNEFSVVVRYNEAVSILHKIQAKMEGSLEKIISPLMPYGLSTDVRGNKNMVSKEQLILHASDGITYIDRSVITKGFSSVPKYKILISKTSAEHAGEPGKDGKFKVLTSSAKVIGPNEVCTHSYFTIGEYNNKEEAENALSYLKTRFVRFLILLSMSSINLSKQVFSFTPMQDFSKHWSDEELYKKYGLTEEEINFIESMIKPMDLEGEGNAE